MKKANLWVYTLYAQARVLGYDVSGNGIEIVLAAMGFYYMAIQLHDGSVDTAFVVGIVGTSALVWFVNFANIDVVRMVQR